MYLHTITREICTLIPIPSFVMTRLCPLGPCGNKTMWICYNILRVKCECGQGCSKAEEWCNAHHKLCQAPTPSGGSLGHLKSKTPEETTSRELQSISISCQERPDWNGFCQTRCHEILFDQIKNNSLGQLSSPPHRAHTEIFCHGVRRLFWQR